MSALMLLRRVSARGITRERERRNVVKKTKNRDRQRLKDELSKARRLLCLQYELGMFCFAELTEKLIKSMEEILEKEQI
jgi:hypothetical protein